MDSAACNTVNALYLNNPDLPLNLDGTPETKSLCLLVAQLKTTYGVRVCNLLVGAFYNTLKALLVYMVTVNFYGQKALSHMYGNGAYSQHGKQKTAEHVLCSVCYHAVVSEGPVKFLFKALPLTETGCVLKNQNAVSVRCLLCVQNPVFSQKTPVSGLASAFGIEDGSV